MVLLIAIPVAAAIFWLATRDVEGPRRWFYGAAAALAVVAVAALVGDVESDNDEATATATAASVYFLSPLDGETVTRPVTARFGYEGLTVEPSGEPRDGAGHLHVLVDVPCAEPGSTIATDDASIHLGDGRTEAALDLAPGEHELCLQAGDGAHRALDVTDEIGIAVKD